MSVELSDAFFAKAAGWEAMKQARALLQSGKVLSSNWTPPVLKGVVQEGSTSYRAGLLIKNSIDIENLCSCRSSREWGTICAHSIAIGLHHLHQPSPVSASVPEPQKKPPMLLRSSETGEPAELFIIFPPNFVQAVPRGKVMLSFEAKWRGGCTPLNVLPKESTYKFSEQDCSVLDAIETLSGGEPPAVLMLGTKDLSELLEKLTGHPRLSLGKSASITVSRERWTVPVKATLEPSGEIQLTPKRNSSPPLIVENGWVFENHCFQPLGFSNANPARLRREQVPQFLYHEFPKLMAANAVEANFKLDDFSLEVRPPKFILELRGGLARLEALLQCAYGPRILTLGVSSPNETIWLPDPDSPTRYSTRDLGAEKAALGRLLRAGFGGPDQHGRYLLVGENSVLNFFARELPRIQREWQVSLEERLERSTSQKLERIEPRFQVQPSGEQWFDLDVSYTSESGECFSAADIQRLLLSGQGYTRLRSGKMAVIDTSAVEELQEMLLDCSPQQHAKGYRVSNTQAGFIDATLRREPKWQVQAPSAWRERAQQISGEAEIKCPSLGDLENVLRPYQKTGVGWLHFLRQNSFGGILADEMGLGKTLQTLAFIRTIRREAPVLIVCPTSLVFNWMAEANRFTPSLKVLALNGPDRDALFPRIPEHDVVITSYALIRRDAERYRELEFDLVALDEAQHIKNRQTQNAQAVKSIRARHRLVLTGTPLENSVLDLWSIFDFLMPGYLGAAQDFRERYEIPIARHKDAHAQERLARRLRPFILRRLKRDVAPELPPKLEQVAFCELSEAQRAIYQQVLEATRREVVNAVEQQGIARSRMVVLNSLLRLRQICCDLRLLKLEGEQKPEPSGKMEMFDELMDEAIDGGHRILVFSQFVSMLALLKEKLHERELDYCYLDGSTANRAEVVQRFQTNSAIPVFLISLKAGGVGLNLAGADTVIHFDPWWNPAVEDQATDRAHRIGQTRVVTSYKLITRGTVEEKIVNLQTRKREIINATLDSDEQFAEALTWNEIQELLA